MKKAPEAGISLVSRVRKLSTALAPHPTAAEARLDELPGIRAVLFDVYGTLFISASGEVGTAGADDSELALTQAISACSARGAHSGGQNDASLRRVGVRGVALLHETIAAHHRQRRKQGVRFPEVDIRWVWSRVLGQLQREDLIDPDNLDLDALAVEYECRVNPVWPMPGAEQLLAALRARCMVLGIVSNAQFYTPLLFEAFWASALEQLGFSSHLCVWSYEQGVAKPCVELLRTGLNRLRTVSGIGPQAVLYVGNDMRNDILPAVDLGCRSGLFAGDRRSYRPRCDEPRCREASPNVVLTDLGQLVRLLA